MLFYKSILVRLGEIRIRRRQVGIAHPHSFAETKAIVAKFDRLYSKEEGFKTIVENNTYIPFYIINMIYFCYVEGPLKRYCILCLLRPP